MIQSRREPARALLLDAALGPELAVAAALLVVVEAAQAVGLPVGVTGASTVDGTMSIVEELASKKRLSREYFIAACLALRTPPSRCLYVDIDDRAVSAARVAGLLAYRWNGPTDLPYLRAALGLQSSTVD
jgi:putative hydrolase of the HAD superfamily